MITSTAPSRSFITPYSAEPRPPSFLYVGATPSTMIGPHHTVPSIPSTASFHRARSFALIVRNALSNCLSLTLQECQQVRTLPIQRNGVSSCTRCLLKIGASIRFRGDREIDSIRISIPSWNQLAFPLSPPLHRLPGF